MKESNNIHQTEGFILRKKNIGEADKVLTIFTKNFGKIRAISQGSRYLKSKLRYNLEILSHAKLGLVQGRGYWRITDSEEVTAGEKVISAPENLKLFSRMARLIDKMVQGEERSPFLWNELNNIFHNLNQKELAKEDLQKLEQESLKNILENLGYLDREHCTSTKCTVEAINKAIKESML